MLQKKPGRFCSRCRCPPGGGRCPRWHRTRRSGARPASSEVWLEGRQRTGVTQSSDRQLPTPMPHWNHLANLFPPGSYPNGRDITAWSGFGNLPGVPRLRTDVSPPQHLLRLWINLLWRHSCKSGVSQGWRWGMRDWGGWGGIGTTHPSGWKLLQVCWSTKPSWDSPGLRQQRGAWRTPSSAALLAIISWGRYLWDPPGCCSAAGDVKPAPPSSSSNRKPGALWEGRDSGPISPPLSHWSFSAPSLCPLPKVWELLRISRLPCFIFHGRLHSGTSHQRATPSAATETFLHLCFCSESDSFLPLDFTEVLISETDETIHSNVTRILPLCFSLSTLNLPQNQGNLGWRWLGLP